MTMKSDFTCRMPLNKGQILKGVGGFYYVLGEDGCVYECKARGRFRKDGIVPLPGDFVRYNLDKGGFIEEIEQRKNELIRPKVTNVDMLAIVVSAQKPKIDYLLCDKLIVSAKRIGIKPVMVINKCDAATEKQIGDIRKEYECACDTVCISTKTKQGFDSLEAHLKDHCTCLAGQSAAGKTSIINALFHSIDLETGGLSKKTDRGRHTTRHAELLLPDDFSGTIVDTPGFSFYDDDSITPEQLCSYYDDMLPYASDCRFTSCHHENEPDCAVKKAVKKD